MCMTEGFCLSNQATLIVGGVLSTMSGAVVWLARELVKSYAERTTELLRLAERGNEISGKAVDYAERSRQR
jgi:hypothetical protein